MKESLKRLAGQYTVGTHKALAVLFSGNPVTVDDIVESAGVSKGLAGRVVTFSVRHGKEHKVFMDFSSITDAKKGPAVHAWEGKRMKVEDIVAKYNALEIKVKAKKQAEAIANEKDPLVVECNSHLSGGTSEIPVNKEPENPAEGGMSQLSVNIEDEAWVQLGRSVEGLKRRGIIVNLNIRTHE